MNGDMLTVWKYHHIVAVWLNTARNVKLSLTLCRDRITVILICADAATPNAVRNIGILLTAKRIHIVLYAPIKKEIFKRLRLVRQCYNSNVRVTVLAVAKGVQSMVITKTTLNLLMSSGYAGNVTLPNIGKIE